MPSSSTRCCACLLGGDSSDFRHTRERTGLQVRSFVSEAGLAERFPELDSEGAGTTALVLCKRAGCLLSSTRNIAARRAGSGRGIMKMGSRATAVFGALLLSLLRT